MQPRTILDLPNEILQSIGSRLPDKCSLSHLSRTIKLFHKLLTPILYEKVELEIRMRFSDTELFEALVDPRAGGLRYTKSLTVGMFISDSDFQLSEHGDGTANFRLAEKHRKLNVIVRTLVSRITRHQLRTFRCDLALPLDAMTVNYVAERQSASLRKIEFREGSQDAVTASFRNITDLNLCTSSKSSFTWTGDTIARNASTLVELGIGSEIEAAANQVWQYGEKEILDPQASGQAAMDARVLGIAFALPSSAEVPVFIPPSNSTEMSICNRRALGPPIFANLLVLRLVNIDLTMLLSDSFNLADLPVLDTFRLESCYGTLEFLTHLAEGGEEVFPQSVTSFGIRDEQADPDLQAALFDFLDSAPPLSALSILLQGDIRVTEPDQWLEKHGPTLEKLVWDQRMSPIESDGLSTAAGIDGTDLNKICKMCPNLDTLGCNFHLQGGVTAADIKLLLQLSNLRVLNIRNLPEPPEDLENESPITTVHERMALDAARQLHPSFFAEDTSPPPLIVIGHNTLVDAYELERTGMPYHIQSYLQARYYIVSEITDALGQRRPYVTEVSTGTSWGCQPFGVDLSGLETFWLV